MAKKLVYGLWYGGPSYSQPDRESLEVFPSISAAKRALWERYYDGDWSHCDVTYADGRVVSVLFPCVERESTEIGLFLYDPREGDGDWYPDRLLSLGARGGVRVTPV